MSPEQAIRIAREALLLTLVVSAPMVIGALVVGLLVSLVQAATQLQENTLSIVPKILAVYLAIMVFGLWAGEQLLRFSVVLWEGIAAVAR